MHGHGSAKCPSWIGTEYGAQQVQVAHRISTRVVNLFLICIDDVFDAPRRRIITTPAFCGLVAVRPFVVAGRIYEWMLECRPLVIDGAVVSFGTVLLA